MENLFINIQTENVTLLAAFLGGILSFISPCVLPLIPVYVSFISGTTLKQLQNKEELQKVKKDVILNSFFFVIGVSSVFFIMGAAATTFGRLLLIYKTWIALVGGLIIILFGLHLGGIIRIPFLYYEKRMVIDKKPATFFGSFLIGFAFAFGWTPCLGPIISAILAVAAVQNTIGKGMLLIGVYSLGFSIPFLITAFSITQFFKVFDRVKKHFKTIELITGGLLVIIGIVMIVNSVITLSGNQNKSVPPLTNPTTLSFAHSQLQEVL